MRKIGLTLIEVMVATGIFLIIVSMIFSVTGSGRMSWMVAAAKLYLSSQGRQASTIIQQELSLAHWSNTEDDWKVFLLGSTTEPDIYDSFYFQIPLAIKGGTKDGELDTEYDGNLKWGDGTTQGYLIQYRVDSNANLIRRVLREDLTTEVNSRIVAHNVESFSIAHCCLCEGVLACPSLILRKCPDHTPPCEPRPPYVVTITFSISQYLGGKLPAPITTEDPITFSVMPMN